MSLPPVLAIVGRPNVGKSSLLNRIVGYRHAIVDPTPGVTRDRNYAEAVWNGRHFCVVDTGGLDPDDQQPLMQAIRSQVDFALREAAAILFVCDARDGLHGDDREILRLLRKSCPDKPLYVAVNKIDNPAEIDVLTAEFYALGVDRLFPVSAVHGMGVADLLDVLVEPFERKTETEEVESAPLERIAIVGKPNVGKSSLFNRLLGQDRSIVDNVPGTTRDAITVSIDRKGRTYRFIDTAGLRRPARQKDNVEFFSVFRTLDAIQKSDLAVLVLDASEGKITEQDKRIAGRVVDAGSGCVIVWNKWDVADKTARPWDDLLEETRKAFPLLNFAPVTTTSARTGQRVDKLFDLLDRVQETGRHRITDERLRQILYEAVTIQPPSPIAGRPVHLKNLRQLNGPPIVFRVTTSDPKHVHFSYQRYLLNHIRQEFAFEGWPVRLSVAR
ncbi:MAG TPA: ribosome biogenesis GTPase Der [Candidatus Ozemobacteraceae bacterium]|nr:ribosome biogenesis GTPase Der [Candidatus Ozemobacteraceae bacterium]